jgi:hypothetical protein
VVVCLSGVCLSGICLSCLIWKIQHQFHLQALWENLVGPKGTMRNKDIHSCPEVGFVLQVS